LNCSFPLPSRSEPRGALRASVPRSTTSSATVPASASAPHAGA
jgi:hypothetical protein